MDNGRCLISIFMPVYNGSQYLKESIKSILNQTFKDFELVCVDDSSTDDSYDILTHFASLDSRIKVLRKPNGGNVPKSWNFVMPYLHGDSIAYMSQDDLMSEDNLEKMYLRQQATDADAVLPDMELYYERVQSNERMIGLNGNRDVILTNREAVLLNLTFKIPGCPLWRSKLFKNEFFPEDCFNSDEYMTRKLLYKSNKVAFCDGIFFYRQDNTIAITKTFDLKNYYGILASIRDCKLLEDNHFDLVDVAKQYYATYILYFKLYRFCLLRRAINSEQQFQKVRAMLGNLFSQLDKRFLFEHSRYKTGLKRLKTYAIYMMFYDFSLFKVIMSLVFIYDRSTEFIKTSRSRY
jgi:glycosyltransferase involved in cell wall biosynthesis